MTEKEQQHIFKNWVDLHQALIFKVVRAYAFSAPDQDDLFQEIMIQVWRSIPKFREEAAVTTWIYRIAINTALKWIRKEQKHNQTKPFEDVPAVLVENRKPMDDRLVWLYEEINRLNEIDRSITLLLLDNFSYKEMANIMGITETNVGVRINRIKKYLISKSKQYDHHGI